MKNLLSLFFIICFSVSIAIAENIQYGYNANGEYVPVSVGNKKVEYSYNARGEYKPSSIGGRRIRYNYGSNGMYLPTMIGN